jgi:hypothetical protein
VWAIVRKVAFSIGCFIRGGIWRVFQPVGAALIKFVKDHIVPLFHCLIRLQGEGFSWYSLGKATAARFWYVVHGDSFLYAQGMLIRMQEKLYRLPSHKSCR